MKRLALTIVPALLLALAGRWLVKACAQPVVFPVFVYSRHPDLPRSEFIDGRMGVLQPTFARSYLVIAYRYLNGVGLNEREREQARDFYKDRETGDWDHTGTDWSDYWRRTRSTVKAVPLPPSLSVTLGKLAYSPENHNFDLNCAEDAFRVAAHTLEARRQRFGLTNPGFLSWVQAQDAVFENCDSHGPIPPEAAPELPQELRNDRRYQIAAGHFYAGQNAEALRRFQKISQENASEWSTISHYLVVRTLLRMQKLDEVQAEAERILKDERLSPIHGMTGNLLERAHIKQNSQEYFDRLAELLATPGQDDGLREELWNYSALYDQLLPDKIGTADLTDWIIHFQSQDPDAGPHCLEKWRSTHSDAWLLAALRTATPQEAEQDGLLSAARALPEDSPAYLTVAYFINARALKDGDLASTRARVDKLLASTQVRGLPSSVNLFRGLRFRAAPGLNDFLRFALQKPITISNELNSAQAPDFPVWLTYEIGDLLLHPDAARILNTAVPFDLFAKAASSPILPRPVRQQVLMAAFTRGLLLKKNVDGLVKQLENTTPEIRPLTNSYLNESSPEGRQFAAAFLLLHRPEARPYLDTDPRQTAPGKLSPYRDNWWCGFRLEMEHVSDRANKPDYPGFPGPAAEAQARADIHALAAAPNSMDYIGPLVFTHQKLHPNDPRIPEALHRLVVPGHLACENNGQTHSTQITRQAFQILHRSYPRSIWTKRTPIWWD